MHDEFYTDLDMRAQFNKFVQFIITRYANEPTIMAWELANDPCCNSSVGALPSCNMNTITQWHTDEPKFIKSIDPITWLLLGMPIFCHSRWPSDFDLQEWWLSLS